MKVNNKETLRILIYGEPYEWAMAFNMKEAWHAMGHEVHIFDWTQWLFRTKKYTLKNRIFDRIFYSKVAKKINDNLIDTLKHDAFDLLVVLKGVHLFPATITEAKKQVEKVVNWNPDDFFNPLNNSNYLLESFKKYDCIFTPRNHLQQEYYENGARRVEILNWYYLPKFQHPVDVSPDEKQEHDSEIAFIGTWSKRREKIIGELQQFDVTIWGTHWHRASQQFKKSVDCRNPIYSEDMCKAVCSAKINLNILTQENRDTTNVRNFEIAACSGFQLSERSGEILKLFEEDKEIACFGNSEELVSKCDYYLRHPDQRDKIRLNGHERVLRDKHTMADRAR
ncbi:glycosyltransferase, partial [Thermodesulfobacteriota bacterium]